MESPSPVPETSRVSGVFSDGRRPLSEFFKYDGLIESRDSYAGVSHVDLKFSRIGIQPICSDINATPLLA